jgi:DNA-binding response OmpR family regulator
MPVMDGLTCLRAMRANAALVNVPVILLTAMSEKRHVLEAANLGVKDYLLKSRFSLTDLLTRVKGALGGESAASAEGSPKQKQTALPAANAPAAKPAMAPSALDPAKADAAPRQRQAVASATRPLLTREEVWRALRRRCK